MTAEAAATVFAAFAALWAVGYLGGVPFRWIKKIKDAA